MKKRNLRILILELFIASILFLIITIPPINNYTLSKETWNQNTTPQMKTPQSSIETAWTPNGTAICTANNFQFGHQICSDGDGGAIITWYDNRSGLDSDIYAQRIDSKGLLKWTIDGVAICTEKEKQSAPQICSDGVGGAIITWQDYRDYGSTSMDIYAQRIDADGNIRWTNNGIPICTESHFQEYPEICSDEAGGAVIVWSDSRTSGTTDIDIYAQKVDSDGNVIWINDGVPICTANVYQFGYQICSDGDGGAIITWNDYRNDPDGDIYAQRLDSNGTMKWLANGTAICTESLFQVFPQICSDGSGGAIITWYDYRSEWDYDIYAQKIDTNGVIKWTINGIEIIVLWLSAQVSPQICSDGAGGAIIAWEDYRDSMSTSVDIYAQSVNSNGAKKWPSLGVAICTKNEAQHSHQICSDGAGGAIITWSDLRNDQDGDIYAQGIESSGVVKWISNGTAICTATELQLQPKICSDGAEGAIIAWYDYRNEPYGDIYAQRIKEAKDGDAGAEAIPFGYNFLFFTILSVAVLIILTIRRIFYKFK